MEFEWMNSGNEKVKVVENQKRCECKTGLSSLALCIFGRGGGGIVCYASLIPT